MIEPTDVAIYLINPASELYEDVSSSVSAWSIDNKGGYCLSVNLTVHNPDLYPWCNPTVNMSDLRVKISLADTDYFFLIEEISNTVTRTGISFQVWGRSEQALLGEKYAKTISDNSESEALDESYYDTQELCEGAGGTWTGGACDFSERPTHPWQGSDCLVSETFATLRRYTAFSKDISWDVDDYTILAGSLVVDNIYPIDFIKKLADAIGAEVVGESDGSLTIRAYTVDAATAVATESYNETDDIVSLSTRLDSPSGYNAVTVSGAASVDPAAYMSAAKLTDDPFYVYDPALLNSHIIRIYFFHPKEIGVTVIPIEVYISDPDNVVQIWYDANEETMRGLEEKTETVALSWGYGQTTMPSLAGLRVVEGDPKKMFDTKNAEYTIKYEDFRFKALSPGEYQIGFYFDDMAASTVYSFTAVEMEPIETTTLIIACYDDLTEVPLPNITVEIDGVGRGTTDSNGFLTVSETFDVGSTHAFYGYGGEYDSSEDELNNENFVVNKVNE